MTVDNWIPNKMPLTLQQITQRVCSEEEAQPDWLRQASVQIFISQFNSIRFIPHISFIQQQQQRRIYKAINGEAERLTSTMTTSLCSEHGEWDALGSNY